MTTKEQDCKYLDALAARLNGRAQWYLGQTADDSPSRATDTMSKAVAAGVLMAASDLAIALRDTLKEEPDA